MKRWDLLASWIKQYRWQHGAEIGVRRAVNAAHILELTNVNLILVEPWRPIDFYLQKGYTQKDFDKNKKIALTALHPYMSRVTIIQDFSVNAAKGVLDASLDFVFIDGDHSYEGVVDDIRAWQPKVRENGWLIGHDWNIPDVKRAVEELLPQAVFVREDKTWYAVNRAAWQ